MAIARSVKIFGDQGNNEVCPPGLNCFEKRTVPGKAHSSSAHTLGRLIFSLGVFLATAVAQAQITLSWNDNSTNEDGFRIERSIDGAAYAEIAVVGANTGTYQDVTVNDSQVYTYRVRAYNAYGNSDYSNAATG